MKLNKVITALLGSVFMISVFATDASVPKKAPEVAKAASKPASVASKGK